MARLGLLIALPPFAVRLMFLIRRQAIHPMPLENAMDRGARDLDAMKTEQIRRDSAGAEVIVLA